VTELNSDRTALINRSHKWIKIDENTPRGAKLQLINKPSGVAQYGKYDPKDTFFTHYYSTPTFDKDEE